MTGMEDKSCIDGDRKSESELAPCEGHDHARREQHTNTHISTPKGNHILLDVARVQGVS